MTVDDHEPVTDEQPEEGAIVGPVATGQDAPVATRDTEGKGYHILMWKGRELFQCNSCPHNDFDERRLQTHVRTDGLNNALEEAVNPTP